MSDPLKAEVSEWLSISRRDLEAARLLAQRSEDFIEIALYHCQRSAEKAIKGFLAYYDRPFPKTHDVAELVRRARAVEPTWQSWEEAADILSDYATAYRYPGVDAAPTQEQTAEALDYAEAILQQSLRFLPAEVHPEPGGNE